MLQIRKGSDFFVQVCLSDDVLPLVIIVGDGLDFGFTH